jgi:hypothetical protein
LIVNEVLRAFLGKQLARLIRHVRFLADELGKQIAERK